ncbi:MAG: transporter substrate-binding domain-containing protein [Pseudonocardia sp.]|nr:transporter substrate-binding domain-containing protein [Pseudonocardia sp.]
MTVLTRRRLLTLAGAGVAAAAVGGCGSRSASALERGREDGVLRVGLAGERPYGYSAPDGSVTGEQPVVARAILATLGIGGIEAVQVGFGDLIDGLRSGQFDMVAAGMTITPRRCGRVAFSRPDFLAPIAFLVPDGNPRGIRTFEGVGRAGLRLGVLGGSAEEEFAAAAGVDPVNVTAFGGQGELFRAVAGRRVEAAALTRISLLDELSRNPGSGLQVTQGVAALVDGARIVPAGAFAFAQTDTDLRDTFDAALAELHASGEWERLTAPFGFTADNVPPRDLTAAAVCSGSATL